MSQYRRTNTPTSGDTKTPSGRVNKYYGMYIGIVKKNDDAQTMGRLQVWVPEFASDPTDESGWRTVSYCSPFAGATPLNNIGDDITDFNQTQTSYGMWFAPPDLENQVIIFFANGDPTKGFWVGCVYQQNMNQMIPGVAATTDYEVSSIPAKYRSVALPLAEYNKKTTAKISSSIRRPVATPYYQGIAQQGLIRDKIRGVSQSSVRNASPSEVYGILTPGPKNPDSRNSLGRLGGHQFVLDDTDGNENIVLKTRSGGQLRIDETNGMIYLINSKGTGWIQIDEEGNGDWFAAKSITMRAQEDFNIRADRDINFEAGRNVNLKARKDYLGNSGTGIGAEGAGSGGQINIRALDSLGVKVETDSLIQNVGGEFSLDVATDIRMNAGLSFFAESALSMNMKSAMIAQSASISFGLTSLVVDIDGGVAFSVDAGAINLNSGAAVPLAAEASGASTPSDISESSKTNVLKDFEDPAYPFDRKTETVSSITPRMMSYEPCPDHLNPGT